MTRALYPGSFDPFHLGHLDTVEQAAKAFDEVVIAVVVNPAKTGRFDQPTRVDLIERSTAHLPSVRVVADAGLTVDVARSVGATVLIRATARDLMGELTMAVANDAAGGVDTVFVAPRPEVAHISSTLVRSVLASGERGELADLVPGPIVELLAGVAT